MGEKGRTSKTSNTLPKPLRQPLMQNLPGLLDPAQRQGSLGAFLMDPSQYAQIGQELGNTAMGGRLNVADTEAGKGMIQAITNQSNQALGSNLADMRSRFAQSGQNLSGPLLQASQQAIEKTAQNRDDTIAQQLFNQFGNERALQQNALQGYSQYQQTPAQMFGSLGNMFTTQYQTQPKASPVGWALGK